MDARHIKQTNSEQLESLITEAHKLLSSEYNTRILFNKLNLITNYSIRYLLSDDWASSSHITLNHTIHKINIGYDKLVANHYHPDNLYLELVNHDSNLTATSLLNELSDLKPLDININLWCIILDRLLISNKLISRGDKILSTPVYKLSLYVTVSLALKTEPILSKLNKGYLDSTPKLHRNINQKDFDALTYRKEFTRANYLKNITLNK